MWEERELNYTTEDTQKRWVYTQVYEDDYKEVLIYLDKRKDGNYDVRFIPTHNSVRINKNILSRKNTDNHAKSISEQLLYEELEKLIKQYRKIMEELKRRI